MSDDDHVHGAGAHVRGRSERGGKPRVHRPVVGVGAVRDRHDLPLRLHRPALRRDRLAAHRQTHGRAGAGAVAGERGLRVDDIEHAGIVERALDERPQHAGAVSGGAAAAVVVAVGDDDRIGAGRADLVEHFGGRGDDRLPVGAPREDPRRQLVGAALRQVPVAVGDHGDRGAHVRRVGQRKAGGDRRVQDARPLLQLVQAIDRLPHRRMGGDLVLAPDHRQRRQRQRRPHAVAQHARHQIRALAAALGLIDLRVGLAHDDPVRVLDHLRRDVRVDVELDDDRRRADRPPHGAQDGAVGVVLAFRHHGAVQLQQYAVDAAGAGDPVDQLAHHRSEVGRRQRPAGVSLPVDRREQLEPVALAAFDEAADRRVAAPEGGEEVVSAYVPEPLFGAGDRGRDRAERTRLMGDAPERDPFARHQITAAGTAAPPGRARSPSATRVRIAMAATMPAEPIANTIP